MLLTAAQCVQVHGQMHGQGMVVVVDVQLSTNLIHISDI
jgi:hypothetical protein